jgi:copper chaperone NosL
MRHPRTMILVIFGSVLAGCRPTDTSRPPTVLFGEEACASCRMIIGDEHFAAALVTPEGEALKFDDIGCLIEHESERLRPDVVYWVRDTTSREWLDARAATFVHSPSVASPMGFGLAAHPSGRSVTEPKGRMLRFPELPGFLADQRRDAESDRAAGRRTEPPSTGGHL